MFDFENAPTTDTSMCTAPRWANNRYINVHCTKMGVGNLQVRYRSFVGHGVTNCTLFTHDQASTTTKDL
jgi:hypothetical protein